MYQLLDIAHLKVSGNVLIRFEINGKADSLEVSEKDFNDANDYDDTEANVKDFARAIREKEPNFMVHALELMQTFEDGIRQNIINRLDAESDIEKLITLIKADEDDAIRFGSEDAQKGIENSPYNSLLIGLQLARKHAQSFVYKHTQKLAS